ncbi:hypothetical protein EC973_001878 [Apophysomyces ossiformis]|uniref:Uncharacterized protein n=1 Tax=Apophysomyces ossiformis TaxID=679940 RepID=A0A8H7BLC2_9FUNG|nr:hypothetical protein EC973_001878 [Apophysomyces ossiformis]
MSQRCVLSMMPPKQKGEIIRSLNVKDYFRYSCNSAILACREVQCVISEGQNRIDEKISNLQTDSFRDHASEELKSCLNVLQSFSARLLAWHQDVEGESRLIIETIRPFIQYCINSQIDAKSEWMTYHLVPAEEHPGQATLVPDFVIYADPRSNMKHELLFMESSFGKEMQIALNKLVLEGVSSPEVVGLLVEGVHVCMYKMNLPYDGQYHLVQLSEFNLPRNGNDDLLLIPTVVENLHQLRRIVSKNLDKLYDSISMKEQGSSQVSDQQQFMRQSCGTPVIVKK